MKLLKSLILAVVFVLIACEEGGLLIEPDISNNTLSIIAPSNGSEVAANTVFFDWEPVADALTYEIQVATPDFENTAQLLLNAEDSVTVAELQLPIGNYQWRVRAKNSNYQTSYTTASFSVVAVENFSDNVVILTSPENNLVTNNSLQTLQWQTIDEATLYRVQVLDNGNVSEQQTTTDTFLELTFDEGEFEWQVRAENGTDSTAYYSRTILIDITAPNTPTLTTPADTEELTTSDVSFEWTRTLLEGSVEFDSIFVYRDIGLTDLVVKDEVTSPYSATLVNDDYYWFVKGFDQAGNQGGSSSTFSFSVNE